eukprot:7936236-Pyramimonas_sp.AAC.1
MLHVAEERAPLEPSVWHVVAFFVFWSPGIARAGRGAPVEDGFLAAVSEGELTAFERSREDHHEGAEARVGTPGRVLVWMKKAAFLHDV